MEKRLKLIHLIYGIAVSLLLCLCGILAIYACVQIYQSGEQPFTRASISEQFSKISWAIYTLLAFILGGAVLELVFPQETKKTARSVNYSQALAKSKSMLKGCSQEGHDKMEREQVLRFVLMTISFILIVAGSVSSLVYSLTQLDIYALVDGQENTVDVTGEIARTSLKILYFYIVPVVYTVVSIYVCKGSIKRELELVKAELKSKDNAEFPKSSPIGGAVSGLKAEGEKVKKLISPYGKYIRVGVTCALAVVSVVFIALGIANGGMEDVVAKAIAICRECIGMG